MLLVTAELAYCFLLLYEKGVFFCYVVVWGALAATVRLKIQRLVRQLWHLFLFNHVFMAALLLLWVAHGVLRVQPVLSQFFVLFPEFFRELHNNHSFLEVAGTCGLGC